jgi:hypothetical protein
MNAPFPFGFPGPTAFYLTLYVITLVVHVAFMNYVLAGTAWIAWDVLTRRRPEVPEPVAVLRDWMPLMLSGAITAGIAPLLFLQILYQEEFYTANLLLSRRWLSVLPVLVVGFYALYLLKTAWLKRRGRLLNAVVGVLPFLCVAFVGYSWTENHLLSLLQPSQWAEFYASGSPAYFDLVILPRLLLWAFGSLTTLALILGWQLGYRHGFRATPDAGPLVTCLQRIVVVGAVGSVAAALAYGRLGPVERLLTEPLALPYLVAAVIGLLAQVLVWHSMSRAGLLSLGGLVFATAGWFVTVLGMTVCREAIRVFSKPFGLSYYQHAEAAQVGGLGWFLFFFLLNAALIGLCFVLVRRGRLASKGLP